MSTNKIIEQDINVIISRLKKVKLKLQQSNITRTNSCNRIVNLICKYYECKKSDIIITRIEGKRKRIVDKYAAAFTMLCYLLKNYGEMDVVEISKYVYNSRQKIHSELNLINNLDIRDKHQLALSEDKEAIDKQICEIL